MCSSVSGRIDSLIYVDSSALVKLVLEEPESAALQAWLQPSMTLATCALARTEVIRSVLGAGDAAIGRARELLRRLDILALDAELLDAATMIEPAALRGLDAIHLAAAITLGEDLAAIVTYDRRMAEGATALGLAVVAPGTARASTLPSEGRLRPHAYQSE